MLFADIDILDENLAVQPHRWVGVRDGRIAFVSEGAPEPAVAARLGRSTMAAASCSCQRSTTPTPIPP